MKDAETQHRYFKNNYGRIIGMERARGEGTSVLLCTMGKQHLRSSLAGTTGMLREAKVLN